MALPDPEGFRMHTHEFCRDANRVERFPPHEIPFRKTLATSKNSLNFPQFIFRIAYFIHTRIQIRKNTYSTAENTVFYRGELVLGSYDPKPQLISQMRNKVLILISSPISIMIFFGGRGPCGNFH
jgi:hypothetical protein